MGAAATSLQWVLWYLAAWQVFGSDAQARFALVIWMCHVALSSVLLLCASSVLKRLVASTSQVGGDESVQSRDMPGAVFRRVATPLLPAVHG